MTRKWEIKCIIPKAVYKDELKLVWSYYLKKKKAVLAVLFIVEEIQIQCFWGVF